MHTINQTRNQICIFNASHPRIAQRGLAAHIASIIVSLLLLLSPSQPNAATQGELETLRNTALAYLFLNQHGDGYWPSAANTDIQAASAVLQGLHSNGIDHGASHDVALAWLANTHPVSVPALASQAAALGLAGWDNSQQLAKLSAAANGRYPAWGAYSGYQPSLPDTAIALDAWFISGVTSPTASSTVIYLRYTAQNTDGGWPYMAKTLVGAVSGNSRVIPTAYSVLSLSRAIQSGMGSQADISEGINWLLGQQLSDGGFSDDTQASSGEVYETALVLKAFKEARAANNSTALALNSPVVSAQDFLVLGQQSNGSWHNDVLATATVLYALASVMLADADSDGIPDVVEPLTQTDPLIADASVLLNGIGEGDSGVNVAAALVVQGQADVPFHFFVPHNGATPTAFVVDGGLPPGLQLNEQTGEITGTPVFGGEFPFSYIVYYPDSPPEEYVVTLTIAAPVNVNVPLPLWASFLMALMLLAITAGRKSKLSVVSIGLLGISAVVFNAQANAQSAIPAETAKVITDAFIDHPAQRNETVRSISEHVNNLSKALEEYHSEEARKMFAKAHRTAIDALNKRLNEELAGKRNRFNKHPSSVVKLSKSQIAAKDESLQGLYDEIDALQSVNGKKVLDAFLSIRKRLDSAKGIRYPDHPVPTWTHGGDPGKALELPKSKAIPAYLSDTYRERGSNMYAFNGDVLLLASAPNTATEAQSCDYTDADLADDGQDITITPEIEALAKKLNYSVVKIFEYVANEIEFLPYYGALKGAHATFVTKSGGATDQSSLLIALLRASNIPTRYVRGDIQADIGTATEKDSRIVKWLQMTALKGAASRLAANGNPAATYSPNDFLRFSHVWVEACVPYAHYQGAGFDQLGHRWIPLDPSFETRHYTDTLTTNVTFDFDEYLDGYKTKMPEEFLEEKVNAAVVEADKSVNDVGYRSVKNKIELDILPASLPYNVLQYTDWSNSGSPESAVLPDSHRYFLHVAVKNSANTTLLSASRPMYDVALGRVLLWFDTNSSSFEDAYNYTQWLNHGSPVSPDIDLIPQMMVGSTNAWAIDINNTVKLNTGNNKVDIRVTMDEYRYGRINKPNCPSVTGTRLINDACFDNIHATSTYSLQVWAHQGTDEVLASVAAKIVEDVRESLWFPGSLGRSGVIGNFLHFMSLGYMKDLSDGNKRIGRLTGSTGDSGMHLGLAGSQSHVESVLDLPFGIFQSGFYVDVPGGQSLTMRLSDGELDFDAFVLPGFAGSAYESHIWQKWARLDAVSTVRGIQYANEEGYDVLTINSENQEAELPKLITVDNSNSSSSAYPEDFIDDVLKANYLEQGFEIKIPDRKINYQGWNGYTLFGTKFIADSDPALPGNQTIASAVFPISGGYAGGYTVGDPISYSFDPIFDTGYLGSSTHSFLNGGVSGATSNFDLKPAIYQSDYGAIGNGFTQGNTFAGDPVNLVTGNFYHKETDLSIPHRDLPFVFERVYNSREPQDGPLGFGWTHSFNHKLVFLDELADEQETTADTNGTTQSLVWIDGTGSEKRIEVSGADSSGVNDSTVFTNRDGQYFNLVREPNGSFTLTEKNGLIYRFESSAGDVDDIAKLTHIESRNGNTLTLTYNGDELDKVTDTTGRFIQLTYTNGKITRMEDWTGRAHEYTYEFSFEPVNLKSYKNPLALAGEQPAVFYDHVYWAIQPSLNNFNGVNSVIKSITLPKGNGMAFEYYVDGRVSSHTNTAGERFQFIYNDFRRETIVTDSRGFTKQYFFNEYGNPVEIINEEGGISTYEYNSPDDPYLRTAVVNEARLRTEYQYNAKGTLVLERKPSGNTVEYSAFNTFEQPGKIKDANGNYQLLKYDTEGNTTDTIALKTGIGQSIAPASYTPVEAEILSWQTNGYDNAGNLERSTQVRNAATAQGFSQQWTFDADQLYATQLQRCGDKNADGVIDAANDPCDVAVLKHDNLGRLQQGVNNRFEKVEYRYDNLNRVIRGTDAVGKLRDYSYDANGNADAEQLFGSTIGNNFFGRPLNGDASSTLKLVDSTSSRFNDSDRLRVSLDAAGNATYYSYDAMGNLATVTNPDNYSIAFEYDGLGRVVSAFDEEGRQAKRDIDPIGRMRSLTDPNGNSDTFSYYDAANDGRLQKQCEAAANAQSAARCNSFAYDANGNVILITDNAGNLTQTSYDALNRPIRIVQPVYTDPVHGQVRPVTVYRYNLLGQSTQIKGGYTDVLGFATGDVVSIQQTNVLNDWGRVLNSTDALGQIFEYQYNLHGDVIIERVPTIALGPRGNNLGIDTLDTFDIVRQYAYGGLLLKEDKLGYAYNPLGQVISIKGRQSGTSGNITANLYNNNYSYTYDAAHRLKTETGDGLTRTYTVSPGGLLEQAEIKRGNQTDTIRYRYDKTGRLQSIGYNDQQHVNYVFDDGGRLTQKRYPGDVNAQYSYFNDNRLKQLLVQGTGTLLQQDLGYDNLGRRDMLTENLNGTATNSSYGYDSLSRLTSEVIGSQTQSFEYDQFSNRTTHNKFDGTTDFYEHNAAHQLTSIKQGSASGAIKARYSYTPAGALHRACEGDSAANITADNLIRGECDLREYAFYEHDVFGQMTQSATYHEPGSYSITHALFQYSDYPFSRPLLEQHYT